MIANELNLNVPQLVWIYNTGLQETIKTRFYVGKL